MAEIIDYKPTEWHEGPYPYTHRKGWWVQVTTNVAVDATGLHWYHDGKGWRQPFGAPLPKGYGDFRNG